MTLSAEAHNRVSLDRRVTCIATIIVVFVPDEEYAMRITIMAIGSRGDVQPLVALGVGLQRNGHQVRLVAGDEFESLVTGALLEFVPLGFNIQQTMEPHTNVFRFLKSITEPILAACQGQQDAIVSTFLGVSTCNLAREQKIPFFYALQIPGLRTRAFPDPLFPPLPLGKRYNLFTHALNERIVKRSYPPAQALFEEPRPEYLFHFSPHLISPPDDWGEFTHVAGFWFLDYSPTWRPPSGLEEFLRAGPPPVYVGFGSTATSDPAKLAELVVEALAQAKQRGVLVTGWGGLKAEDLPSNNFLADSIPFDWLFPQMAAAVHHAGAGTVAAALRAGIPSVTVPFGLDQPFWARQVARSGTGPAPIPAKQLTAERLAAAMRTAVEDQAMRARSAAIGQKICSEDGVGNAVKIIEQTIASHR